MSQLLAGHAAAISTPDVGRRKLLLIGNPNVGKSLLFTRLTRRFVNVSNYPGTTVEVTSAHADVAGEPREVIDTPGVVTLLARTDDERVTRDLLLRNRDADVVVVGDINNTARAVTLAIELAEHDVPFVLCLNMADEAREGIVSGAAVSRALGVPVVATSATRQWNLERLSREAIRPARSHAHVDYPSAIECAIVAIQSDCAKLTRGDALSMLTTDAANENISTIRAEIEAALGQPIAYAIARARVDAAASLLEGNRSDDRHRPMLRERIGLACVHPVWGMPILAAVLVIAWLFVGKLGAGTLVDLIEHQIFERRINVWLIVILDAVVRFPHKHLIADGVLTTAYSMPAGASGSRFVHDLLVGQYGIVTMAITYAIAIVLPVVITFFAFFSLLEDSGYLPRLAIMLNRLFRRMGLNGKAVLPMVLGLGCDTMATLTTRILETKKERMLVTLLLALGVPCSAQLGVIIAMLAPLGGPATAIWLTVTCSTIFVVGWAAARVTPGASGEFILEVPPLRLPRLTNIGLKVLARTEWYLREAVPLFIAGTLLLYLLDAAHLLGRIESLLSPVVVGGLGLPSDAASAFVVGFLRRDYGAAGLFAMQRAGRLSANQVVVALTVITLFIPCVANFFVMIKERGARTAAAVAAFILVYSFAIGVALNVTLRLLGSRL